MQRSSLLSRSSTHLLILALILVIAAGFRLHGLFTWDDNTHQHPDERFMTIVASEVTLPASIGDYFNTQRSPLSPYVKGEHNFAYGQLPLTLTRVFGELTGNTSYDSITLVGRALAALADIGAILFAWLLARRVFGARTAHLTAILLALCVLEIQLSHFFTVDAYVGLFAAAALFFGQRAWQRESLADALLAGVMVGLAAASKVSAVLLLPTLGLAFVWPRVGRPSWLQVLDGATAFGVALVGSFFAFRVAEPYAFAGPAFWGIRLNQQWIADKAYQVQVSSGTIDVPFMIQWAGTPAYTFVLQAIVQWGMGPALGLASLVGLVVTLWRLVRGDAREREALLVVLWAGLNLVYFGGQFAKFLRYLEPAYFALAILAAHALLLGSGYLGRIRRWGLSRLRPWLAPAVVAATACWALAFSSIYDQPHSRIQASDWIYANIPAGATLATEHWDDRLPLPQPGDSPNRYKYTELTLYDAETPAKRDSLEAALDQSDYIILASRRLADSIPRLPERYPMATAYYRMLQDGQLGFERVARFQVEPRLGPLAIDDSHAQEDFTVYDHPLVEVWAKQSTYSSASVRQLLGAIPIDQAVNVRPIDGGKGALLQSPAEQQAQRNAGTWSDLFHPDDWANQLSAIVWLLAAEVLALSSVPLLWRVLSGLPDRGYGASKILGLAFVAYIGWLVASLKIMPFERPLLLGAWLLLIVGSVLATWRERASLRAFFVRERRLLITLEAVFLAGFALFLFLRAANPDLWHPQFGGEKPMNFAYLNAVTKSDYFPPYDPWFSGGIINYYYFGLVLVAYLIKLTGIMPEIAFNLAQPMLFGALCAGVFSVALALSVPARGHVRRGAAYLAGAAAVLMTAILGNLDAGLQLLDQLARLGNQLAPQSGGIARVALGAWAVVLGARFPPLDFWRSTRFIGPEDPGPIHEFPYFTFLYGDLHAHELALPLTVGVLAVGISIVRALRADPGRPPWAALVIGGVLVGMLRATNTWDFPTYGAVTVLMLVLGLLPALVRFERRAVQTLITSVVVFGASMLLSFWPYLQRYQLFYTGVDPVKARTALNQYLTIHGLFLFVGASLLAWYLVLARRRVLAGRRARALVPEPGYYGMILPLGNLNAYASMAGWVAGAGILVALLCVLAGFPTRGVIVFFIGASVAAALVTWRQSNRVLQAALFAVALFATLIPEFVALQGDIGRMNTVFKFYLQAWVLLSISAAVALGWLSRRSTREAILRTLRPVWLAFAAILFVAAVSYPLFASQAKIGLRFADLPLSLDGMEYMQYAEFSDQGQDLNLPGDYAALRWMQEHVPGTPVVLEGRAPIYHWGSRVAIYTGLPTVLGWDWHETQQRSGDNGAGYAAMIQERAQDVERAYASPDPQQALSILRRYDVGWVYVGGLERAYYPAIGLDKFRNMQQLHLVYDADGVQIYQVVQP